MRKALLLHGWGGYLNENWLPWLNGEFSKKRHFNKNAGVLELKEILDYLK